MTAIHDKEGRTRSASAQRFTDQGYAARALPEWREFIGGCRGDAKGRVRRRAKKRAA